VLRVIKAAKGAAMMTETSVSWEITHGKCDFIPNDAIHDRMSAIMKSLPLPALSADERKFAAALASTMGKRDREATLSPIGAPLSLLKRSVHGEVGDFGAGCRIGGSLDTGDVSYIVPTAQMNAATWPLGVGAHTWQSCSASGSTMAFKAMRWAAAVLAETGFALATEPGLLAAAKSEHRGKTSPYRSAMDM
jgi:aminobenzoyl-glutamate utilization protein B